ncbi:MAG: hypothetical protein HKO85_09945 [Xanthomonadales bacterium]|nr:hypothetical protein [Gammaproteobacteria bacterium]MBT8050416.1 hypothetical protein [Gammaproteobacteria bacterium]MBT8056511.1 hypothetical protein [Gammaproteobacteria bacterium]NNJ80160.1 hypothetical protein [Xanthomonadales bacterium]NNL05598.1 hypothetical protein [Xanthomonadales bacterium]
MKRFKRTFRVTGGEITGEFQMSTGDVLGANRENCPVFAAISSLGPPWMEQR